MVKRTKMIIVKMSVREANALLTAAGAALEGDDDDRIGAMENRADLAAADRAYDKVRMAISAVGGFATMNDER